jgi:hypothetical protein
MADTLTEMPRRRGFGNHYPAMGDGCTGHPG